MSRGRVFLLLATLLVSACAKEASLPAPVQNGPLSSVLLLADPDGHVGRIVITADTGETMLLDKEKHAVHLGLGQRLTKPEPMSEEAIEGAYGAVLRAMPEPPVTFILYFRGKTANLTRESRATLAEIAETFKARKSTDISIVGHTDRRGDKKYNLIVSEKRAQTISKLLFKNYRIPWMAMEVLSHGEAFPLVETGDSKAHRENQRVEVTVR